MKLKLLAGFLFATLACLAQTFVFRVQVDNNVFQVTSGGSITLNGKGVGIAQRSTLLLTYLGTTRANITNAPSILGSTDFSVRLLGVPGQSLGPGQSATLELTHTPSTIAATQAQLDIAIAEDAPPPATPGAPPGEPTRGLVTLGLNGTVPSFEVFYTLESDLNANPIRPGETITFPETAVNRANVADVTILNRGSGSGTVDSVSVVGGAFLAGGLPLLPAPLVGGASLRFQVAFRPRQPGDAVGTLAIGSGGGTVQSYSLAGRAIGTLFQYEVIDESGQVRPHNPTDPIRFPSTRPGQRSSLTIRFENATSLDILLNSISLSGVAFTATDGPFLPATIAPGQKQTLVVAFIPTQAGRQTARLQIGGDDLQLEGVAEGPELTYAFGTPGASGLTFVDPGGVVSFSSVPVGRTSRQEFTISNRGTSATPVNNIAISSQNRDLYRFIDLPALPVQLGVNESIRITIEFAPNVVGPSLATLLVDAAQFTLSGGAPSAEPLPAYTIGIPSTLQPLQQPLVSLSLQEPYPITVNGTLTLSVASQFGQDGTVQFVTGGNSVSFTIPAGSTRALFTNGSNEVRFQTGTVAGSILVTPRFQTAGGFDLTPANPLRGQGVIATAAPTILNLQLAERTTTQISFLVTGYTLTKSLTRMNLQFTAAPGFDVPATAFPLDLTGPSAVWFASEQSAGFGGQFSVQVTFQLSTSDTEAGARAPTEALNSVSVRLSNAVGESAQAELQLR